MNTPSLLRAVLAACVLTGFTPVRADVVTEWNEIMEQTALATTPEEPLLRARTASITQVAVFEAVNSIVGDYQPYDVGVEAPEAASADVLALPIFPELREDQQRAVADALARSLQSSAVGRSAV